MFKVYISPSTQEKNLGASQYGGYRTEEAFCNHLADLIIPRLQNRGIIVGRNRPEMPLREVVADSNSFKPDLHLAIHTNAMGGADAGRAQGCEVFIHRKGGQAEVFAKKLYENISMLTPWKDRGIKEGHSYFGTGRPLFETGYTHSAAALIEIDFHDNVASVMWMMQNIDSIVNAICLAVEDYAGLPRIPDIASTIDTINTSLAKHKLILLSPAYWVKNAVNGGTCDGRFVAEAFNRISRALA